MTGAAPPPAPRPQRFPRGARLAHKREYDAVHAGKARTERGPLVVMAIPAAGGRMRLGLSIGRRLGGAVRRNRMKRLLREVFRLDQAGWPGPYDVVVSARPHEELSLDEYCRLFAEAIAAIDRLWTKRRQRTPRPDGDASASSPAS